MLTARHRYGNFMLTEPVCGVLYLFISVLCGVALFRGFGLRPDMGTSMTPLKVHMSRRSIGTFVSLEKSHVKDGAGLLSVEPNPVKEHR